MSTTPTPAVNDDSRSYPAKYRPAVDTLPPALRRLLDDEMAAGNTIIEVGHHHPAAPCGVFFMLGAPVTTHPRASTDSYRFFERESSSYSGEFADLDRFCFVLEAPLPPPEPPDMDAIRAAVNIQYIPDRDGYPAGWRVPPPPDQAIMDRFQASRTLDHSQWRDGSGFDLDALRAMTQGQQHIVQASLIPPSSWREVEALAVIGSDSAQRELRSAARHGALEVRLAVAAYAPELVSDSTRIDMLTQALRSASLMGALSNALDQMETFHPPAVVEALLQGVLGREGEVAYHCAELMAVIHGVIPSRFDWSLRPLFLRFNTDNDHERRDAWADLQRLITRSRENTPGAERG